MANGYNVLLMCSLQVENAVTTGKTGLACTDEQRRWNAGTVRNIEPKGLRDINFSHHRAGDEFGIMVFRCSATTKHPTIYVTCRILD